ncbi:MAG: glycoside hydrolase, partial [Mycobacterium sp.]|nr:glycoside hydrolase [Mycobacterium sp.]
PAERHQLMLDSITTVMRHYAGKASTVTVVNEAFDQMGKLQHTVWWDTTHSDKSNAIYDLVKRLRDTTVDVIVDGTPTTKPLIDGIGFHGHMLGGQDQQSLTEDMAANLQRFADLGVTIRFTELDVRIPVVDGVAEPADLDRQRDVYKTMTELCLHQPRCSGITLWGFTDKRSWITDYPDTSSGYGAATPTTATYVRKPAWDGILDTLTS